jgi:hypothetical protein
MKAIVKALLPETTRNQLRSSKQRLILMMLRAINACTYSICRASDYYSPLPVVPFPILRVNPWRPAT